jgi:hypothetical protein
MLCDDAEFAPRGARERLTAFLLRSALRIAVKPVLSPNVPLSSQRRWLKRSARLIQPRWPINIQDGIVGAVKGEWVRSTPTAANGGQSGAILYLHGGAYCVGSPATYRAATACLARITGLLPPIIDLRPSIRFRPRSMMRLPPTDRWQRGDQSLLPATLQAEGLRWQRRSRSGSCKSALRPRSFSFRLGLTSRCRCCPTSFRSTRRC